MPLYRIGDSYTPPADQRSAFSQELHSTILQQPMFEQEGAVVGTAVTHNGCPVGELRFPPPPVAHLLDFVSLKIAAIKQQGSKMNILLEGNLTLPVQQPTVVGFEQQTLHMRFYQVISVNDPAMLSE